MNRRNRVPAVLALATTWALAGSSACDRVEDEAGRRSEVVRVLETATLSTETTWDTTPDGFAGTPGHVHLDPPALAAVRGEPVVGRTGPGGQPFEVAARGPDRPGHDRLIGLRTFEISLRGSPSTTDACGSCHRPGQPVIQAERIEDAHRYILPRHPTESGTHCITCHAPDDVERLVLASGERVGLDHAYRLCAQCHYAQVDAWAAGVHGKRLDGWRGRRVVMGCADCHDPHQPAIEPRMPFPGPQLPRTGRQSP
jgi:hypothetical protein